MQGKPRTTSPMIPERQCRSHRVCACLSFYFDDLYFWINCVGVIPIWDLKSLLKK